MQNKVLYTIKSFCILCILAITVLPMLSIATKITADDWLKILNDSNFWLALQNSVLYSAVSAVFVTMLAIIIAYFISRSDMKTKKLTTLLLTFPLLIPSLSIGLGVKCLFGKNGFLDKLFGISNLSLGFGSLILCSVIALFPTVFMIIYDALQYEDKSIYDAANALGISKLSSFFRLTLPYLASAIGYALIVSFSIIFSDYGIPMETAGIVKTLPMYLYECTVSSFAYGKASICAICLLVPSIGTFIIQVLSMSNKTDIKQHYFKTSKGFTIIAYIISALTVLFLMIPELSFAILAFVKAFPNDMTFTVKHFSDALSTSYGLTIVDYIKNSLLIASLTAIVGTVFAYLLAYFSTRFQDKLSKIIDLLAIMSLSIPGMVLGICYVFAFSKTKGWFYNTIIILIVVNIAHMFGSAYVMAKNCLLKQNKDYEMTAKSLGISNISLLMRVLIPNSKITIVSMIGYFFVNSMTTVTAVLFLCSYLNQPLSVMITIYDRTLNYEMQATISVIILAINMLVKLAMELVVHLLNKEKETSNIMTKQKFLQLTAKTELSDKDRQLLEQYKVKKAIILAAGFGERLLPITAKTPKPLVSVNGKVIIETLITALHNKNITDISIVVGYKKEQFNYLKSKYGVNIIENTEYATSNNISSLNVAIDELDRCYICEADLLISNPDVIHEYEYETCFLGFYCPTSNDWCAKLKNGKIDSFKIGGNDCYQTCGISYWSHKDAKRLKDNLKRLYASNGGKELLWDMAAFDKYNKINIGIREIDKCDITEIDNFSELCKLDPSYAK